MSKDAHRVRITLVWEQTFSGFDTVFDAVYDVPKCMEAARRDARVTGVVVEQVAGDNS